MKELAVAFVNRCSEKRDLFKAYLSALDLHNIDVCEYAKWAKAGLPTESAKSQSEASREACQTARKRYSDHTERHGC